MPGQRRTPRGLPALHSVPLFDRVVGLVAFALLTLAAFYLIVRNAPLQNEALVTIYFAVTAGILASALLGGSLNLKTDVQGVSIRASGGAAVFALIMVARFFLNPTPDPPAASQDNFTQNYGRAFGAMEFPALLRVVARQQGDLLGEAAAPGGAGPALIAINQLVANGCAPQTDDGAVALPGKDAAEMEYSSDCAFEVDRRFVESASRGWPAAYRHARIVRTPLADNLLNSNGLGERLLYAANARSDAELLCLASDTLNKRMMPYSNMDGSAQIVAPPGPGAPPPDALELFERKPNCSADPTKRVGYLYVILQNKSQQTFDKVTVSFKVFRNPATLPAVANFYEMPQMLGRFDPGPADASFGKRLLDFLHWRPIADAAYPTYDDANCVVRDCESDTTIQIADVAPGAPLLLVLAGYRARGDKLEDVYLTDVYVPLHIDYEIDGRTISEPIAPPGREKSAASRVELDGGWGWTYQ